MTHYNTTTMPARACSAGSDTQRCSNLRPHPDGTLRPVGRPALVAPAGHRPMLHFNDETGRHLITALDRDIYITTATDTDASAPRHIYTAPDTPQSALHAGGMLFIGTALGKRGIDYRDGTLMPEGMPVVWLEALTRENIRAYVPARRLDGDYRQESDISDADHRRVSADYRAAYAEICSTAAADNAFVQPVLAAYELLDADGSVLFSSPPVLLGSPQCVHASNIAIGSSGVLDSYYFYARKWRMQLRFYQQLGAVRSVRVSVSPQLHPVLPDADADTRLSHSASSTSLAVALQPSQFLLEPKNADTCAHTLRELVARFHSIKRTVAEREVAPGDVVEIFCSPLRTPSSELSSLASALSRPVPSADADLAAVGAPHSFAAEAVAVSGHTVAWGCITPRRYEGYPLGIFAASTDSAPGRSWSAYVAVDFAGGAERMVWEGSGLGHTPLSLNPLLCYPAADASAITVAVRAAGLGTATYSAPLVALPGGRAAVAVDASFAPVPLEFDGEAMPPPLQVPPIVRHSRCFPEMIVATEAAAPFRALAVARLGSKVHRLLPATGSSGAWDYGRTRFMAFGADGVHLATLNAARDTLATARISGRAIDSPDAVAPAQGCVYAASGGDILRVSGNSVRTVAAATGARKLLWNRAHRELWAFAPQAPEATVYLPESSPVAAYTRPAEWPEAVLGDENGAYMLTSDGLRALHREEEAMMPVAWEAVADLGAHRRLRRAVVDAACGDADLELSFSAAGLHHAESVPTRRMRLGGSLLQAVAVALLSRPLRQLKVALSGRVHPDFKFSKINIVWK